MARRRHQEEHENNERWLVSYTDFITPLFVFFLVMYSISSINEGKYRILSDSLEGVFSQPDRSIKPVPVGEERPRTTEPDVSTIIESARSETAPDPLQDIAKGMREAFGDMIMNDQMTVRGNELWIEIELSSSLLFSSGEALPTDMAFNVIEKIAKILAPYENPVHIEGFTDNLPINTAQFPSNWELSTARAASIVRMLAMDGVNPGRLAAVGYGEFQPVADNALAEGRARNRRVVLVISRNLEVRRSVSGVGSANARPDSALQRAGTQPAAAPAATLQNTGTVNAQSPAP